jgi:hypothetical protein
MRQEYASTWCVQNVCDKQQLSAICIRQIKTFSHKILFILSIKPFFAWLVLDRAGWDGNSSTPQGLLTQTIAPAFGAMRRQVSS